MQILCCDFKSMPIMIEIQDLSTPGSELQTLMESIKQMSCRFRTVQLAWVRGHTSSSSIWTDGNQGADALAYGLSNSLALLD